MQTCYHADHMSRIRVHRINVHNLKTTTLWTPISWQLTQLYARVPKRHLCDQKEYCEITIVPPSVRVPLASIYSVDADTEQDECSLSISTMPDLPDLQMSCPEIGPICQHLQKAGSTRDSTPPISVGKLSNYFFGRHHLDAPSHTEA